MLPYDSIYQVLYVLMSYRQIMQEFRVEKNEENKLLKLLSIHSCNL